MESHKKKADSQLIANQPFLFFKVAGWTRLELATSCVTGRRSNQLNYHPLKFILCTRYELSVSCQ